MMNDFDKTLFRQMERQHITEPEYPDMDYCDDWFYAMADILYEERKEE